MFSIKKSSVRLLSYRLTSNCLAETDVKKDVKPSKMMSTRQNRHTEVMQSGYFGLEQFGLGRLGIGKCHRWTFRPLTLKFCSYERVIYIKNMVSLKKCNLKKSFIFVFILRHLSVCLKASIKSSFP